VLPDQGLYEERYRLTGTVLASLALSLVMLGIGVRGWHEPIWIALSVLAFATVTVPVLVSAASRRIAFRADPLGVTLGANPQTWPGRDNSPVFISWADVERIVIYQADGTAGRLCVGVQRRPGAPPLPSGNEPARRCPLPGVDEGATRQANAWRLDRERLASLVAAVAPGVPVIDASRDEGVAAIKGPGA
jgi:hypothetical protein